MPPEVQDKFQGYASFGYLDQKGTQPGQAYERYTLKTSFDITPVDWFKMGSSINASYSTQDYGYSFSKSVTGSGDFYSALRSMTHGLCLTMKTVNMSVTKR